MKHIVIIRTKKPREGLMGVIAELLTKNDLIVNKKRVVTIEDECIFFMEGTLKKPIKRNLGKIPDQMKDMDGRCYVYRVDEVVTINMKGLVESFCKECRNIYVSDGYDETEMLDALLFSGAIQTNTERGAGIPAPLLD